MEKRLNLLAGLMLASVIAVVPAAAQDLPKADPDWPMFIGPDGSRVPTVQGYELLDDIGAMRKSWTLAHHTGVGKGLYPSGMRTAKALGIDEPFYGGAANLIAADGKIFCSYYKPDGRHPAEPRGWRTMGDPQQYLADSFFSVTADDILIAVDAETGKLLWQAVEAGGGMNRLAHKRAHWVRSPAYWDGRVFSIGSMGTLRAYRATDGRKLWETETSPGLVAARQKYIQQRKMIWDADDQSSVIVADGVVVIADRSLSGYDAEHGERLWHIDGDIMSPHGTPTIWRHDGRTYVLAHTGRSGQMRLIDPKNGQVLWTHTGLGPRLGTLSVENDIVVTAFASDKGEKDKDGDPRQVLYGALRLSLEGAEKLWVMPDEPRNRFHWKHDKGPRYRTSPRDGLVYLGISPDQRQPGEARGRVVVVEAATGKIIDEKPINESLSNPIPIENKLWVTHDYSHSNPITQSYWQAGRELRQLSGVFAMPHASITGYYIDLEPVYYKGRLYFRGMEGILCYDLRKQDAEATRILRLSVPQAVTGLSRDRALRLYTDDGSITHGNLVGSDQLHDVDVSRLQLDGDKLTGELDIGIYEGRHPESYFIDAKIENGQVSGTIAAVEKRFGKPLEMEDQITAMVHQPAWMPPASYVLRLENAARNRENRPGRLLLLPTVRDGKIVHIAGWADQTTKSPPAIYYDKLRIEDGRLVGELAVRYRPDRWTTPLVEHGDTAAAVYQIDARLQKGDGEKLGSYTGVYGAALKRTAPLEGSVE